VVVVPVVVMVVVVSLSDFLLGMTPDR